MSSRSIIRRKHTFCATLNFPCLIRPFVSCSTTGSYLLLKCSVRGSGISGRPNLWPSPQWEYSRRGERAISELDDASTSSALRRVVVEYNLDRDAPVRFVLEFKFECELFFISCGALSVVSV